MRKASLNITFFVLFITIVLTGCRAVGDIFKAGVWSGIIIVVLIVILIFYFISKARKQ